MAALKELERELEVRYADDAQLITSQNAIRVLRRLWP